jgi:hypothetical protein
MIRIGGLVSTAAMYGYYYYYYYYYYGVAVLAAIYVPMSDRTGQDALYSVLAGSPRGMLAHS